MTTEKSLEQDNGNACCAFELNLCNFFGKKYFAIHIFYCLEKLITKGIQS